MKNNNPVVAGMPYAGALAAFIASVHFAHSTVYVKDPVPVGGTPAYAIGSLKNQNPTETSISGFNGVWTGDTGVFLADAEGLSYPDGVLAAASGGGFVISHEHTSQTTGRSTSRSIVNSGLPAAGGLYFSVLVKTDATAMAELGNNYAQFIGVSRTDYKISDATAMNFFSSGVFIGFRKVDGTVNISLGVNGTAYPLVASVVADETYFCVVKVDIGAGTDGADIVSAVVNPASPSMDAGLGKVSVEANVLATGQTFTHVTIGGYYATNRGKVCFDEFMMGDDISEVAPVITDDVMAFSMDAASVTHNSATATGELLVFDEASVTVFLDWGLAGEEFGAPVNVGSFSETTLLYTPLSGLMPDTAYQYRHRADYGTSSATSSVTTVFITSGAVEFSDVVASNELGTVYISGNVSHDGAATTTVSLWFGDSPENLSLVETWGNVPMAGTFSKTITDCLMETIYYYMFKAGYEYAATPYAYGSNLKSIYTLPENLTVRTLYWGGGSADIPNGTPLPITYTGFAGTWDKTTKNWSIDELGTAYVAWEDGADMTAVLPPFPEGQPAYITLTDDIVLNKLVARHNYTPAMSRQYNNRYHLTASEPLTITLGGDSPEMYISAGDTTRRIEFEPNVSLVAPQGFAKTGLGNIFVKSESPGVGGTVSMSGSSSTGVRLEAASSMNNVAEFHVNSGAGFSPTLKAGENDKIGDSAIVRLTGTSAFLPRGSAGSTERFRQLVLDAGGRLDLSAGAGEYYVTDGISRGVDGTGILFISGNSNDEIISPLIIERNVDTGVLLPWASTLQTRPLMLDSATRQFVPMSVTAAPDDLTAWVAGSRYRIEGAFAPQGELPDTSVESLGVYNSNGGVVVNIEDGATLDITSGQLAFNQPDSGTRKFAGGRITSSSGELYVTTGTSGATGNLTMESELTGDIDLMKAGSLELIFTGPVTNTYTGVTYVNGGRVTLYANRIIKIPGDVVISRGATLYIGNAAGNMIHPGADITIREGGTLLHNNSAYQTYGGVMTFVNGTLSLGGVGDGATFNNPGVGVVFANGGTIMQTNPQFTMGMNMFTDVRYEAASTNQAVITTAAATAQRLTLTSVAETGPITRTFEVNDSDILESGIPEMVLDIPLATTDGVDAEFVKTGTGMLVLERISGRFRGTASVLDGTLLVNGDYATQSVMTAATHANYSGTLRELDTTDSLYITQPVVGDKVQNGRWVTSIVDDHTITLSSYPWSGTTTNELTFLACGALGTADVTASGSGILGGTGGVGGSLFLENGGTFDPGTPADPVGVFHIGGNLDFIGGGNWKVDITDETTCDVVHVAGDILLAGTLQPEEPDGKKIGFTEWVIATYEGTASGMMSAPQGYRVLINNADNTVRMRKSFRPTLLIIR